MKTRQNVSLIHIEYRSMCIVLCIVLPCIDSYLLHFTQMSFLLIYGIFFSRELPFFIKKTPRFIKIETAGQYGFVVKADSTSADGPGLIPSAGR